jgi:hypothetical protein
MDPLRERLLLDIPCENCGEIEGPQEVVAYPLTETLSLAYIVCASCAAGRPLNVQREVVRFKQHLVSNEELKALSVEVTR